MNIPLALLAGFLLDQLVGDPIWLPHPVEGMGWLIQRLEALLRRLFPKNNRGELAAGAVLVLLVCAASFGASAMVLWGAARAHPLAAFTLQSVMAWQVLAVKSLGDAAGAVYRPLVAGQLAEARTAVSRIVGRDTWELDAPGVVRAAVETVSENTGDGVVAPMIFFALGGGPLAMLYKAVNTMDSMVGYRNSQYEYFGRVAARLDDLANYLPARLSGLLLVGAAWLCRLDARRAWRVMFRDRRNHKSPNAPWPEAACAGALGLELGGTSLYGGVPVIKPTLGDPVREPQPRDILEAVRLEQVSALLCLVLCLLLAWAVV